MDISCLTCIYNFLSFFFLFNRVASGQLFCLKAKTFWEFFFFIFPKCLFLFICSSTFNLVLYFKLFCILSSKVSKCNKGKATFLERQGY